MDRRGYQMRAAGLRAQGDERGAQAVEQAYERKQMYGARDPDTARSGYTPPAGNPDPAPAILRPDYVLPVDRWLTIPNPTTLAPGIVTAAAFQIRFNGTGPGWLVQFRGTTRGDGTPAGRASIGVQLNLNGKEPIMTDGSNIDYPTLDELSPEAEFAIIMRHVLSSDVLLVTFKNWHSATTYTPAITIGFKADPPDA